MTFVRYRTKNRARGNLLAGISAGATSMTLESGDGNLFGTDYPYMLAIEELDVNGVVTSYEFVKVTNKSGDTFTIVRAQEGTSGIAFDAGDQVSLYITAALIDDVQTEVARLETDKLNLVGGLRTGLTAYRTLISNGSGVETTVIHGASGRVWTSTGASSDPTRQVPTVDITALTEDTSPDESADFILTYDTSAGANKKVKPDNIDNNITGKTSLTEADTSDELEIRDTSASANKKITKDRFLSFVKRAKEGFYYFNDFIGTPLLTGDFIGVVSGTGAVVSETSTTSAGTGHIGAWRADTGTTTTGRSGVFTGANDIYLGLGVVTLEMRVRVTSLSNSSGGNRFDAIFGLFDTTSSIDQVDGVYFLYDEAGVATGAGAGSANWKICGVSNSSRTITTSSTAVSTTYVRLRIVINAGGTSAEFFVNDVSIGTVSSNIPTGISRKVGAGSLAVKNAATGSGRGTDIDYIAIEYPFTASR